MPCRPDASAPAGEREAGVERRRTAAAPDLLDADPGGEAPLETRHYRTARLDHVDAVAVHEDDDLEVRRRLGSEAGERLGQHRQPSPLSPGEHR